MLPLGINGLDYWLGINHGMQLGISRWPYLGVIILQDYWTVAESTCRNGFKWITDSLHWIQRCNCLMQGGKQYENLSEGLKLSYTAWTTSPAIGSFHFVADLPAYLLSF
jgi:hypothetical protein